VALPIILPGKLPCRRRCMLLLHLGTSPVSALPLGWPTVPLVVLTQFPGFSVVWGGSFLSGQVAVDFRSIGMIGMESLGTMLAKFNLGRLHQQLVELGANDAVDLLDMDDKLLHSLYLKPLEAIRFRKLQAELQPEVGVFEGDPALSSSSAPATNATEQLAQLLACEKQPPCAAESGSEPETDGPGVLQTPALPQAERKWNKLGPREALDVMSLTPSCTGDEFHLVHRSGTRVCWYHNVICKQGEFKKANSKEDEYEVDTDCGNFTRTWRNDSTEYYIGRKDAKTGEVSLQKIAETQERPACTVGTRRASLSPAMWSGGSVL
jgi:hypothetical protein